MPCLFIDKVLIVMNKDVQRKLEDFIGSLNENDVFVELKKTQSKLKYLKTKEKFLKELLLAKSPNDNDKFSFVDENGVPTECKYSQKSITKFVLDETHFYELLVNWIWDDLKVCNNDNWSQTELLEYITLLKDKAIQVKTELRRSFSFLDPKKS